MEKCSKCKVYILNSETPLLKNINGEYRVFCHKCYHTKSIKKWHVISLMSVALVIMFSPLIFRNNIVSEKLNNSDNFRNFEPSLIGHFYGIYWERAKKYERYHEAGFPTQYDIFVKNIDKKDIYYFSTNEITDSEASFINKNKKIINEIFYDADIKCSFAFPGRYVLKNAYPFRIYMFKEDKCFMSLGGGIDVVYNTLKMPQKKRAADVSKEEMIQVLKHLARYGKDLNVKYIGTSIVYFYKDFSSEYKRDLCENLITISAVDDVLLYKNHQITLDELYAKSFSYVDGNLIKFTFE